jgi:hypothetical protein
LASELADVQHLHRGIGQFELRYDVADFEHSVQLPPVLWPILTEFRDLKIHVSMTDL